MRLVTYALVCATTTFGIGCATPALLTKQTMPDASAIAQQIKGALADSGTICESRGKPDEVYLECKRKGIFFSVGVEDRLEYPYLTFSMQWEQALCREPAFAPRLLAFNGDYALAMVSCKDESLHFWHATFLSSVGFTRADLARFAGYWIDTTIAAANRHELFVDGTSEDPRGPQGGEGVRTRAVPPPPRGPIAPDRPRPSRARSPAS
jgi:hypothetical protein